MRLFYKKSTSILIVAATIVLIFLLCMLLITLTQLTSLKQTAEKINALYETAQKEEADKQELLAYYQTDKYVIDWAVKMGLIPDDVIVFINGSSK